MQFSFTYNKAKVIQALRYHFLSRKEIRLLMIVVNVFAVLAAALFYLKKVRPEPFLFSTIIWLLMLLSIWYALPFSIYKKTKTFTQHFSIKFTEAYVHLQNGEGEVNWPWEKFTHFVESPNFFHLYFSSKSFFLVPKDDLSEDDRLELRAMIKVLMPQKG